MGYFWPTVLGVKFLPKFLCRYIKIQNYIASFEVREKSFKNNIQTFSL